MKQGIIYHKEPPAMRWRVLSVAFAVLFFIGTVLILPSGNVAYAELTDEELALEAQLEAEQAALSAQLEQSKAELAVLEAQVETEVQQQAYLSAEIDTLTLQIEMIIATIAVVQENINLTQLSIEEKIQEIAVKEAEYEEEFAAFGARLASMQELNDGGAMAILSTVQNLYQLLTFDQTLQDISDKNAEMLYSLDAQRVALENAKVALEAEQLTLETQYAELETQYASLETTKASIYSNYIALGNSIEAAEVAQAELEAQIDEDTIRYDEIQSELESLLSNAEGTYGDLTFSGDFICPVESYTYISTGYDPYDHPAIDYAAPAWTPIYATADGYVTAAQWNSGGYGYYVLIYHGEYAGNTFSSLYAHMVQAPSVSVGAYVTQGQLIGYVGSTGYSTGNHLHYELWANSSLSNSVANKATRVNPLLY